MKLYSLFLSILFIHTSCSEDRGAVEVENLSKKIFESIRKNDEQKFNLNLLNQSAFEKLQLLSMDSNLIQYKSYAELKKMASAEFEMLYDAPIDWSECTFANALDTLHKYDQVVLSKVVVKFKEKKDAHKFQFQAIKLDGLWYYYSGLKWIPKELKPVL